MYPAGGRKVFYLRKEHNTMDKIFEMIGDILKAAHASEASKAVIAALQKFFGAGAIE